MGKVTSTGRNRQPQRPDRPLPDRLPIAFPLTPADTEPPPHPDTAPVGARQSELWVDMN
ncbi:MAG: hypothetical protein GDA56_29875 [Hormoscilla sp. GM7CHS1pb]|nr:hypothetical protein [Hormoscilla sp. GM7CHS1pb]